MTRRILVALSAILLLSVAWVSIGRAAQSGDLDTSDADTSEPSADTGLPDGFYWGQIQDIDVSSLLISFVPQCTGVRVQQLQVLPSEDRYPRSLPVKSATELWYLVVPDDGDLDGAYYDRVRDLSLFRDITELNTAAPWWLKVRDGVVDWIQEDGFRLGVSSCEAPGD